MLVWRSWLSWLSDFVTLSVMVESAHSSRRTRLYMAWYGLWSNPCIADYVEIWVAERMREQFALGVSASKEQDDDLYDNLYDRGMTICMTVCMTEV